MDKVESALSKSGSIVDYFVGDSLSATGAVSGIVILLFGIAYCFFGYKVFRFLCGILGFVIGGVLGYIMVWYFQNNVLTAFWALIMGLCMAVISYFLYLVYLFLALFAVGFSIVTVPSLIVFADSGLDAGFVIAISVVLGLAAGITAGVLACMYSRQLITVISGLNGGYYMGMGTAILFSIDNIAIYTLFGLMFAGVGIMFQFYYIRKRPGMINIPTKQQNGMYTGMPNPAMPLYPNNQTYSQQGQPYSPQQNSYPQQALLPQQTSYPQQNGYPHQALLPQQNGYPTQNSYPQQNSMYNDWQNGYRQ